MQIMNTLPIDETSEESSVTESTVTEDSSEETTSESTSVISGNFIYQVEIYGPDGSYYGTIYGDDPLAKQLSELPELKTQLIELKEIEKNQLAASQKASELQENTYTLTAYIFAAILGFGLIQLLKGVLNSIFGG